MSTCPDCGRAKAKNGEHWRMQPDAAMCGNGVDEEADWLGDPILECHEATIALLRQKLAAAERENAQLCAAFQAIAAALGILDELPTPERVAGFAAELREKLAASERENSELRTKLDAMPCDHDWIYGECRKCGAIAQYLDKAGG